MAATQAAMLNNATSTLQNTGSQPLLSLKSSTAINSNKRNFASSYILSAQ